MIACLVNDVTWDTRLSTVSGLQRMAWDHDALTALKQRTDLRAVLVEVGLRSDRVNAADLHGLRLARELRVGHKVRWPILMTSVHEEHEVFDACPEGELHTASRILRCSGTAYIRIVDLDEMALNQAVSDTPELSEAGLEDINTSMLDLHGFLAFRIEHDLYHQDPVERRNALLDEVANGLTVVERERSNYGRLSVALRAARVVAAQFDAARNVLAQAVRALGHGDNADGHHADRPYRVILLEDNDTTRNRYCRLLTEAQFDVRPTGDANEALRLIDEDADNEISAVISDWRLWVGGMANGHMQQKQGYDILDQASRKLCAALFAITSLSETHINEIRNRLGIDFWLLLKRELDNKDDWSTEISIIRQRCQNARETRAGIPTSDGWRAVEKGARRYTSHHDQYLKAIHSLTWPSTKAEVSELADMLWTHYSAPFLPKGGVLKDAALQPLSHFGISPHAKPAHLQHVLAVRRVYFGLWAIAGHVEQVLYREVQGETKEENSPAIKICCVFEGSSWESLTHSKGSAEKEMIFEKLSTRAKNLANSLGIATTDIPQRGIFPEERSWLLTHGLAIEGMVRGSGDPATSAEEDPDLESLDEYFSGDGDDTVSEEG